MRFLQLTMPFPHLRSSRPIRIESGPFRHPLPKLPRPGRSRLGLFLSCFGVEPNGFAVAPKTSVIAVSANQNAQFAIKSDQSLLRAAANLPIGNRPFRHPLPNFPKLGSGRAFLLPAERVASRFHAKRVRLVHAQPFQHRLANLGPQCAQHGRVSRADGHFELYRTHARL
jgi:hypothetical protein